MAVSVYDKTIHHPAGTSVSFSATTGGSNRYLILSVHPDYNSGGDVNNTPTVDGNNMSSLVNQQNGSFEAKVRMYGYLAPASGTVTVAFTLSALGIGCSAVATCFQDVDQTTPIGTPASAGGSGTTATVDVGSATGELVFDSCAARKAMTVDGSQTQVFNDNVAPRVGGSTEAGATTVTMSWSLASTTWAIGGVSLKPAAGGGGPTVPIGAIAYYLRSQGVI